MAELFWFEPGSVGDQEGSGSTPGVWHATDWNQTGRNWEGEGEPPLNQQAEMLPSGRIVPKYNTDASGEVITQSDGAIQLNPDATEEITAARESANKEQNRAGWTAVALGFASALGPSMLSGATTTAAPAATAAPSASTVAPGLIDKALVGATKGALTGTAVSAGGQLLTTGKIDAKKALIGGVLGAVGGGVAGAVGGDWGAAAGGLVSTAAGTLLNKPSTPGKPNSAGPGAAPDPAVNNAGFTFSDVLQSKPNTIDWSAPRRDWAAPRV